MILLTDSKDLLFGKSLHICGRKFMKNKKQDYITIVGPASCKIKAPVTDPEKIRWFEEKNPAHVLHGDVDCMFHKQKRLICEPNKSDCPEYRGTEKHKAKIFGHTPGTWYSVDAIDLCAVGYIDFDRQPRKPFISLRAIQLKDPYYSIL